MQAFKRHLFAKYGKLNLGRYCPQGKYRFFAQIVPAQIPMIADSFGKFDYVEAVHRANFTTRQTRVFQAITIAHTRTLPRCAVKQVCDNWNRALAAHGWKLP